MIELQDVAIGYGGNALLSGVTLRLAPGAFYFLTGPSGAGKTSLLKLCYGEMAPLSGRLTLFGKPGNALGRDDVAALRQRIGVVHQDCQFLDHLPLAENVTLPLVVAGKPVNSTELTDLLTWVGLREHAQSRPSELSGGERQRAALARAVIRSPDLILADEPTGNLDWEMSLRLLSLLMELNRMGKTVVVATHDLNLIRHAKAQVQARVLRISGRRLLMAGADL